MGHVAPAGGESEAGGVAGCESRAGVPFGHAGIFFGCSFAAEEVGAECAVAYVWRLAVALDGGGVTEVYPYVVEHCGGACLVGWDVEAAGGYYEAGQVGHGLAMAVIYYPQGRAPGVIFVDDVAIVSQVAVWVSGVRCQGLHSSCGYPRFRQDVCR